LGTNPVEGSSWRGFSPRVLWRRMDKKTSANISVIFQVMTLFKLENINLDVDISIKERKKKSLRFFLNITCRDGIKSWIRKNL
jgi:hypothetical protein